MVCIFFKKWLADYFYISYFSLTLFDINFLTGITRGMEICSLSDVRMKKSKFSTNENRRLSRPLKTASWVK